jgi:DNA-binding winged helix-turn-helix (wHTH) protein/predicted ATPase
MAGSAETTVAPLRLDRTEECLWRGTEKVRLTPKAFAVLGYLVEHAPHLVKKDDLLKALWPDVYVSDAALTVCIREIRKALDDDPQNPRYIETVHRRGFRFIGKIAFPSATGADRSATSDQRDESRSVPASVRLVGRESELQDLERHLETASRGERQIVFVSGEPGIGKTALVSEFTNRISAKEDLSIAYGQCIEQYGAGEAYLPVLQALGQLCRGSMRTRVMEVLDRHAPSWLVQMPSLFSPAELEALQRKHSGVSRERMLREMAEAVEALTAERALLLVLEDLHWSDYSTLDLVSALARRREAARLLVIGTYRPVELIVSEHPLRTVRQELQLHGQCTELPLRFLSAAAVTEYLAVRFGDSDAPDSHLRDLAEVVHRRTEGSPLFMIHVLEGLRVNGTIAEIQGRWRLAEGLPKVETEIPQGLRQMIERDADRLASGQRRLLETASVAGQEFSAAAVAAGMEEKVLEVEERCEEFAQREQWLSALGPDEWPDGTVAGRYRFRHALYQEVLYLRLPVGRRVELHRRIGEREEAAYGERRGEIAAELAMHFERGRDYQRAAQYHQLAAETAIRRSAHAEAVAHSKAGLELLKSLPDSPQRIEQELALLVTLGVSLVATNGYSTAEVGDTFARAREICVRAGETPRLFIVLFGLWLFYVVRPDLRSAEGLAKQLFALGKKVGDPALLVEAHYALAATRFFMGDFASARDQTEQCIHLYDPRAHRAHAFVYGQDPAIVCRSYAAWALWYLGYPDQALRSSEEGLTLARDLAHPFSLAFALTFAAMFHQSRREPALVERLAESAIALCAERGFRFWWAWGSISRARAVSERGLAAEGIAQIRQGLASLRAISSETVLPYALAMLAEAYAKAGQAEEGLNALAEALGTATNNGDLMYEAELYRLKGELLLLDSPKAANRLEAESCFRRAIAIARKQSAKSLELRAATSLSRLLQRQGKTKPARKLLADVYGWFSEGFDTADLKDAKALLENL